MTVSKIKYKTILLAVNYYFIISESEKIKNKRISMQLSDVVKSVVKDIIISKQIQ